MVQSRSAVISEAPRDLLQAIALGGMLVLILYLLSSRSGTLVDILPTLGVFAFAGLRLFPALQSLYREFGRLKVAEPVVDELYADIMETRAAGDAPGRRIRRPGAAAARPPRARRHQLRLSPGRPDGAAVDRPRHPARRLGRHRRRHRRRQDHARRPRCSACSGPTRAASGWTACRSPRDNLRAWQKNDRLRAAADLADRRHGRRQHRLRHPARGGSTWRPWSARRRIAELHDFVRDRAQGRLPHRGRRPRRTAVGRPAPAHRHRPRALPRPRRADPRRGDQRARQPHREGGDDRGREPRPGQDHRHDRAPAHDRAALRHASS